MSKVDYFQEAIDWIEAGQKGENEAIPLRKCPKLTKFISGTKRGCYYLYGAETGIGKTKFARDQHIYTVYDRYKEIGDKKILDVAFLDFSLEITGKENMVNAIIRKIYIDDHVFIDFKRASGESLEYPLTKKEKSLIESKRPYFKEFLEKLIVIDGGATPTQYHNILLEHFRRNGTFANDDGKTMAVSRLGKYTPKNDKLMTVSLFDTINLADNETGQTNKQSIDRISRISVLFRNICDATPIIVQQFNADGSDVQRQRHGVKTPQLRDFEDSKRTTKDANIVIGLWSPMRYYEDTFKIGKVSYDITLLKSWFVSAHILKNRNGQASKVAPLRFNGGVSIFEEFPEHMTPMDYITLTKR